MKNKANIYQSKEEWSFCEKYIYIGDNLALATTVGTVGTTTTEGPTTTPEEPITTTKEPIPTRWALATTPSGTLERVEVRKFK